MSRDADRIDDIGDKFARKIRKRLASHRTDRYTGKLGKTASGPVEVEGRDGYLWVRMGPEANPSQVWNPNRIRPIQDLDVLMGWSHERSTEMQILDVNYGSRGGGDGWRNSDGDYQNYSQKVWINKQNILPFHMYPAGGLSVNVNPDYYMDDAADLKFFIGDALDLTAYVPGTNARFVHVYLDASTGLLSAISGSLITELQTGGYPAPSAADDLIPNVPEGSYPIGAVYLVAGTTAITTSMLYHTRQLWNKVGGETGVIERILTDGNGDVMSDSNGVVMLYPLRESA